MPGRRYDESDVRVRPGRGPDGGDFPIAVVPVVRCGQGRRHPGFMGVQQYGS